MASVLLIATIAVASDNQDEGPKPLPVGEKAINFDLPQVGEDTYVELQREYGKGPVVVIVLRGYPGYQCPLCNRQVGALINRAKALKAKTHKVILVYPGEASELERHAEQFMGSRSVPEPLVLVRDPGMKMVTAWGLRWNAPHETAYPATYVIRSNGRVAWRKISDSHAGRTTVEEILREIKKL
ncbi:MAG: redoxin domain-containing protein [Pirellulaceae bacterium]|nr:redoxin domain-containing protein [Pirellulaceae bacterium]